MKGVIIKDKAGKIKEKAELPEPIGQHPMVQNAQDFKVVDSLDGVEVDVKYLPYREEREREKKEEVTEQEREGILTRVKNKVLGR